MRILRFAVLLLCAFSNPVFGVDDASGPLHCTVDLSKPFTAYVLSAKDKEWGRLLVERLKYSGRVFHFVRTSLPLEVDGATLEGEVYQAVENPRIFYVAKSDAILELNTPHPYNPAVLGFSMHAPKSRHFIVALNFFATGVPFLSSSSVEKGLVTWMGRAVNRLQ